MQAPREMGRLPDLHLTRKDFRVDWFSGTGKGGQHRNKKKCCCRITHTATGISAVATASRHRRRNQETAFRVLAARLIAHYGGTGPARGEDGERVRTYHAERNEVIDVASGRTASYRQVVEKGDIGPMIEARREAKT